MLAPVPVGGLVVLEVPYEDILGFLEGFVTWVLAQGQGWSDAIDGIFPRKLLKVGDRELLLVGTCILLPDSDHAPVYSKVLVATNGLEVQRLECGVGLARSPHEAETLAERTCEDLRAVEWTVEARYGS